MSVRCVLAAAAREGAGGRCSEPLAAERHGGSDCSQQEVIQEMDMPENSTVVADSHRTEESKGGDASGSKDGEVAAV